MHFFRNSRISRTSHRKLVVVVIVGGGGGRRLLILPVIPSGPAAWLTSYTGEVSGGTVTRPIHTGTAYGVCRSVCVARTRGYVLTERERVSERAKGQQEAAGWRRGTEGDVNLWARDERRNGTTFVPESSTRPRRGSSFELRRGN